MQWRFQSRSSPHSEGGGQHDHVPEKVCRDGGKKCQADADDDGAGRGLFPACGEKDAELLTGSLLESVLRERNDEQAIKHEIEFMAALKMIADRGEWERFLFAACVGQRQAALPVGALPPDFHTAGREAGAECSGAIPQQSDGAVDGDKTVYDNQNGQADQQDADEQTCGGEVKPQQKDAEHEHDAGHDLVIQGKHPMPAPGRGILTVKRIVCFLMNIDKIVHFDTSCRGRICECGLA